MRLFEGFQKGINLGGWLSQEDDLSPRHYRTFITEADIRTIRGFGADHVRLPVDYRRIESEEGERLEDGYRVIDQAAVWCKANGLNLLIDMHNTYGYTFDPLEPMEDREKFFRDEALQQRFLVMWERISERYGALPHVAFELLNEVISPDIVLEWNQVASRAVDVIRKNAPRSWIVIGGVRYNNVTSVAMLDAPKDDRIVYNFHCYEPLVFTHQQAYWVDRMPDDLVVHYPDTVKQYQIACQTLPENLVAAIDGLDPECRGIEILRKLFEGAVNAARTNHAPLYCGEYGVIDRAPAEDTLRWMQDIHSLFEEYGIGRAYWTYREKDFGLTGSHFDSIREEMIRVL
ncbi:MAG: glycoside hydrolase family 5 protein [Solobacterium sp.]|nr:glycoside hydrolase family 5 protein [Solobacterium sp.]